MFAQHRINDGRQRRSQKRRCCNVRPRDIEGGMRADTDSGEQCKSDVYNGLINEITSDTP